MLTRWFGYALLTALVCLVAYILIGHAIDNQIRYQDRVITTKHSRTVDCRVDHFEDGSIALNDCNYVQVP